MEQKGIRRIQTDTAEVRLILTNARGHRMELSNFGARITGLWVTDAQGISRNIVLGLPSMESYIKHDIYLGASIGRVAGRIGGGQFLLDGSPIETMKNEGNNTLHGGLPAFESALWEVETDEERLSVCFSLRTKAGENGFPADLLTEAIYTWTDEDQWIMEYRGRSDATTVFNPTNHVYFNLSGQPEHAVADHRLYLAADQRFAVDRDLIATGELTAVAGSFYDFTKPQGRPVGDCLREGGLDTPFRLMADGKVGQYLTGEKPLYEVARLACDQTGLCLSALSDQPTVIVYTFNHPEQAIATEAGELAKHGGITLETQQFPNTVSGRLNPAIILRAGEVKCSRTVFRIGRIKEANGRVG
ncbi:MAG: aldose epimerase family protein [Eubacteriales bacterium]|nr:aldose epimerase family protein [Eubacteriales bacterium]